MHYNSVNRSMAISGFSQTVKNTFFFLRKLSDYGSLLKAIKRSWPNGGHDQILIPVAGVSIVGIQVTTCCINLWSASAVLFVPTHDTLRHS